jgi:DNA-directed RNA polymerase subunit alpha
VRTRAIPGRSGDARGVEDHFQRGVPSVGQGRGETGLFAPKEALYEASRNLIDLFLPFLHAEEEGTSFEENKNRFTPPLFTFQKRLTNLKKNKKGIPLNCIFIDQLELTSRTYNCLKRANIHTLLDLLSKTEEDLLRIDSFRMEDRKHIWDTLEKHLPIDLLKNKLSF